MARPKSPDKRKAILDAAIRVFADTGVSTTPTAAVSKAAGVAEGTLFTYFKTKDDLLNELYRELKLELAQVLMSEFPREEEVRERLRHVWTRYVSWGAANGAKNKVMKQLRLSERLTGETIAIGQKPFGEIEKMANDSIEKKIIRNYPVAYIGALMETWAETTMTFVELDSREADRYLIQGFEIFWNGISEQRNNNE